MSRIREVAVSRIFFQWSFIIASGWLGLVAIIEAAESKKCLAMYKAISAQHTTAMRDLPQEGDQYYRRLHELEDQLFKALEQCPQDSLLFTLMAENQLALNNIQLAFLYAQKAYEQQPRLWQTNHALGTAYLRQQEFQQGLPLLEKATQLAPANPALQFNLCSSYVAAGRHQQAIEACSEVIQLNDEQLHGPAYYQRSQAYEALGKQQQAEADLRRLRELSAAESPPP